MLKFTYIIHFINWCIHRTSYFPSYNKASNACYALPSCYLYGFQESLGPYRSPWQNFQSIDKIY